MFNVWFTHRSTRFGMVFSAGGPPENPQTLPAINRPKPGGGNPQKIETNTYLLVLYIGFKPFPHFCRGEGESNKYYINFVI